MRTYITIRLLSCLALLGAQIVYAMTPEQVSTLAFGESDQKLVVINALVAAGDDSALPLLQSLAAGQVQTVEGKRVLIVRGGEVLDGVTGKPVSPVPENVEDVIVNNRIRGELAAAIE